MEIDITGRHFQVTDALKVYAQDKVRKLDKYSMKIESAHIVFEVQKFIHASEIVLHGKELRVTAKADSTDMYAAFDKSFHNMQLQLAKLHEKRKNHKGKKPEAEEE